MNNIELGRRLLRRHPYMIDELREQVKINRLDLPYDDDDKELTPAQLRRMAEYYIRNYGDLL